MYNVCKIWLLSLLRLFMPRHCAVCGDGLCEDEEVICLKCNMGLPRTDYHRLADNPVERALWGRMPLVRASAYMFYSKGGDYRHVLHLLKYGGRKDYGEAMGRMMAAELAPSGFFDGVDVIVPVPLHPRKEQHRGYNQSECIARGVSAITGLPVDVASLVRTKDTETQTHKSAMERQENVAGIFALRRSGAFVGQHVLLIDDVLTTGATVTACADALAGVEGLRVSVLTLAVAVG